MKTKIFHLSVIAFLLYSCNLPAQFTNVLINSSQSPNETSIMLDPKHTNVIVAGANTVSTASWSGYYYTTNGGLNWTSGMIASTEAFPSGDPVIFVDTLGHFYYLQNCNGYSNPPNQNYDRMLICKSTNGGMSWNNGTSIGTVTNGKFQDKPWGCVDMTHSSYGNNIYTAWTQFDNYYSSNPLDSSIIRFSRSTNGGVSFSEPIRINRYAGNCRDSSLTVEGTMLCAGPDGTVYAVWAGPLGILFNKSTDGGVTWMQTETIAVPAYPGGWAYNINGIMRCNGLPVIACDLSNGPGRGNLYINWSDQRNGPADTDVWLVKSTNGGASWSTIKRVNNDPPGRHQFLNWMCIDQVTGYLYFVYYDRRNFTNNTTDVYLARSTDGGQTFGNVKINSTSFVLTGYVFIGDYNGITAHNNKVRPIWTRAEGGNTSIWTAIIDSLTIDVRRINESVPSSYSLHQNYPNPFNPVTTIKFELSKPGNVIIKVYNISGKETASLVNDKLSAGVYETKWDAANYPSGVYFYRLFVNEYYETRKMMVIK